MQNQQYAVVKVDNQANFTNLDSLKGKKVAVVGSLQNRSYEDNDGNKRNVTEIVANEIEFLSPARGDGNSDEGGTAKRERPQLEEIDDNQLPF